MTQDEAQNEIIKLYNGNYLKEIGGRDKLDPVMGALPFYFWLTDYYPEVLTFPDDGDRYQTIASWVSQANRCHDTGKGRSENFSPVVNPVLVGEIHQIRPVALKA